MTINPKDQQQRQGAIDHNLSVHVEAPAGSGKTTVLMKRFLSLLARVKEPEEVLALTFTRKAAGELRARIQGELLARTDKEAALSREQELYKAELQEMARAAFFHHVNKGGASFLERLKISTFHGFCAQMIRLAPHAVGLPPDFTLMEESTTIRMQKEAVELMRREMEALPGGDPARRALVQRLVRLNNNWPRLAAELQSLLARRDILSEFITLARESRDPAAYEAVLRSHLNRMIGPGLSKLSREFRASELGRQWREFYHYLCDCGAGVADSLPEDLPGANLDDLPAWKALAEGILTKKGQCFKSFTDKFPKNIKNTPWRLMLQTVPGSSVQLLNQYRNMPGFLLQHDEVDALQDLIILLDRTLGAYEHLCHTRRSLDFISLEQQTMSLLEAEAMPEIFANLDYRLTHLLVDEFQDTSRNQIRLLCRLLAPWQGDPNRSLMVVGDPKQSIYGWRQARVEQFTETRNQKRLPCPESPSFEVITLETNFRSCATLIQWANRVFGDTIMSSQDKCGVEFHAAEPKPGADIGSPPQLALFGFSDRKRSREREAAWLAREIALLQRNLAPQETVGVLIFVRTHLPTYLKAFREARLNPRVKDGLPLRDSLPVQHLHNLARALVRPHDDLAWAGLLRGFAGPQSLSVLADIAMAPGDFWSEKIREFALFPHCPAEVRKFYQAMKAAGKRVGREPLNEILADWLLQVEAWSKTAAWEESQGVANLKAYLDLVAGTVAGTPEATVIQVDDLLAEAYQPPDPRAQDSPVEIMTVHKAKGLEYDHVYVPHLDWEPLKTAKNDAPFLLEEMPGTGSAVIALNRAFLQTDQSILYQTLKIMGQNNALAEARRLFYVAVTRAKKSLHLSGVISQNKNSEWKFPDKSPLGWLREHYAEAELQAGVENIWPEPNLTVTINPEVSNQEGIFEKPRVAKDMCGSPHPSIREEQWGEGQDKSSTAEEYATCSPLEQDLPEPYDIKPEPRPYELQFPSRLGNDATVTEIPDEAIDYLLPVGGEVQGEGGYDGTSRLRGEISHRLLETLARGGALPEPGAVAQILQIVIGSPTEALSLAQDILAEINACREDPFLGPLLSLNLPLARSEWLLEAWHDGNTIYRGQIDRLVFDGRQWWLLDYKTSRPGAEENWPEFIAAALKKYRPQLLAYREMAAGFYHISPPELIQTVLYFTAGQRHVLI